MTCVSCLGSVSSEVPPLRITYTPEQDMSLLWIGVAVSLDVFIAAGPGLEAQEAARGRAGGSLGM